MRWIRKKKCKCVGARSGRVGKWIGINITFSFTNNHSPHQ